MLRGFGKFHLHGRIGEEMSAEEADFLFFQAIPRTQPECSPAGQLAHGAHVSKKVGQNRLYS
jgi:hypothetical protein